jgi:hypothetical protein
VDVQSQLVRRLDDERKGLLEASRQDADAVDGLIANAVERAVAPHVLRLVVGRGDARVARGEALRELDEARILRRGSVVQRVEDRVDFRAVARGRVLPDVAGERHG